MTSNKEFRILSLLAILFAPITVILAWQAKFITTGSVELTRWDSLTISNKNVLFFAVLMFIAGFGGYISSKVKRGSTKYFLIMGCTYILVFSTGYAMHLAQPFRFD